MADTPQKTGISLEQFNALNTELAELVRAGIPIDKGLAAFASETPTGQSALARELAAKVEQGLSLDEALQKSNVKFPPVYRAVVAAGLKTGNLTAALEGIVETATRMTDVRRMVNQALVYPMIVLAIGSLLLVMIAGQVLPAFGWLEFSQAGWFRSLSWASSWAFWAWLAAALGFGYWFWLGRPRQVVQARGGRPSRLRPFARLRALGQSAMLADTLRLAMQQGVPLHEAVAIAGEATGNRESAAACGQISRDLREGNALASSTAELRTLPPLVRIAMLTAGHRDVAVFGLRTAAAAYRGEAERLADALKVGVPMGILFGVGLLLVGGYCLTVFVPLVSALYELSAPSIR